MYSATDASWTSADLLKLIPGGLLLFAGLLILGFGFGLFPVVERLTLAERIAAGIFGLPMLGLAGFLLQRVTVQAGDRAGVGPGLFPGRLLRLCLLRITGNTLLAGLPYLLLCAQLGYFRFSGNPWPAGSGAELEELFLLEFAVIHATVFLGLISLVPATGRGRPVKYLLLLLFGGFYAWAMLDRLTIYGYASYLFLLASKFGGYYLRPPSANRRWSLFLRWGVQFCTFVLIASALGNERLSDSANVACGIWYFLLLGLYEILDLFSVDTGPASARESLGPWPDPEETPPV